MNADILILKAVLTALAGLITAITLVSWMFIDCLGVLVVALLCTACISFNILAVYLLNKLDKLEEKRR